jgi:hypothetical protein
MFCIGFFFFTLKDPASESKTHKSDCAAALERLLKYLYLYTIIMNEVKSAEITVATSLFNLYFI